MKIDLDILPTKHIGATVSVKIRTKYFGNTVFLVDTGSPISMMSGYDLLKLKIPTNQQYTVDEIPVNLGGNSILISNELRDITLTFLNKNVLKLKQIYVSNDLRTGKNSAPMVQSLLGYDFLVENKFFLHYKPSDNIAYLEN